MRTEKECRNFIVRVKRLPVNEWSKIDTSCDLRNLALQEQCTNNLFKTDSRKSMEIPKVIKNVNNLKRTQCESTIQSLSTDVPKGCKPLIVKLQRINTKSFQKANTETEMGPIQNRIGRNMRNRNSTKKSISVKPSNSRKSSTNSLNVNVKQNGLLLSDKPIFERNIILENLVLTPEHRKCLNKLSLSKNPSERTIMYKNSTKNLDVSEFRPVKNSTKFEINESVLSDSKREPDLHLSNSKGEKIPRNVTNNSDLIEQLICSNENSELEHVQHEEKMPRSKSKREENLKHNNPTELKQLICHNQHEYGMRSNSKGEKNLRNLTNKTDVLEQLIYSNEASEEEPVTTECKPIETNNTVYKFFQRLPKRKFRSRKIVTEPDNIFDFSSQSSESDFAKNQDPAADIIKKLISEGKVRVATNQKGTGRPILKRGRLKAGRKKPEYNKNKVSKEVENKNNHGFNKNLHKIVEKLDNCVDGTALHPSSNIMVGNEDCSMDDYNQQQNFLTNDSKISDEHIRDEGFSLLARSVLLQETKKAGNTHKTNISEQRRLLEVARKFVSTPAANRKTNPLPTAELSPIKFLSPQNHPMCPSPWRINDDSQLPSVFNFTKNKSYLPTFSSDYIPSSPNKNKANNTNVCNHKSILIGRNNLSNVSRYTASSASNGHLQTSLESKNDSNVENMPPIALTVHNNDDNAGIFNLRQLPNPRRTLGKRSPLKAINIIEVVRLPPWKKTANGEVDKNVEAAVTDNTTKKDKSNDDNLFGFEEFLDQTSNEDIETNKTNVKLPNRQSMKRNLHRKLKDIQNWRPKNNRHGNTCVSQNACEVFENNGPKQRLINEMLCSTMINMKNDKQIDQNYFENCDEFSMSDTEEGNVQPPETDFFNDYEPETTLNKKKTLRTYVRPAKRKRKVRKNFVMFQDSEESTSDTEEEQLEQRKDGKKKRRHEARDNAKANSEIEAFANAFNSMCKDVENYELLVE